MSFQFSPEHTAFMDKSLAAMDERLAATPDDLSLSYNKALMLLSVGRFAEGWKLWERRLELPDCKESYAHFPVPKWDGDPLSGKHVLVWFEQGIGDHIMAASMVPDLMRVAGSVTILTMRRLVPLCRRSFPGADVYQVGDPVPERLRTWAFDCQMSVSDLGLAFRKAWNQFPGTPYLVADAEKARGLRAKYKQPGKPLVGLSWKSENFHRGHLKSMTLEEMMPIAAVAGTTTINLQYGDCASELRQCHARGVDIINDDEVDQLIDMDTFAAQVAAMDVVVSTSNSLVHVAGALGVPTIAMIPQGHGRCWYWFSEMRRSPWYTGVELERQTVAGDWSDMAGRVVPKLQAKAMKSCRAA